MGQLDAQGNTLTQISYLTLDLNDNDQVLFSGVSQNPAGETLEQLYVWQQGSLDPVLSWPSQVGNETIDYVWSYLFNVGFNYHSKLSNSGDILFSGSISGQSTAAILGTGGELRKVFTLGQLMPNNRIYDGRQSANQFSRELSVNHLLFSKCGAVGALATSTDLSGNDNKESIYLSDGIDTIHVATTDEVAPGASFQNGTVLTGNVSYWGGRMMNESCQFVYISRTGINDKVCLYTPDLEWRVSGSGDWDNKGNWTLGLAPGKVHAVSIVGVSDVTVTGSSLDLTVKQLTVGGDPAMHSELQLQGATLTATDGLTVHEGGVLSGSGTVAGNIEVFGGLSPSLSPGEITVAGDITHHASALTKFEIDGTASNQFGRLIVQGDAQLGGTLQVSLGGRSSLAAGQEYLLGDIAGTVLGQFDNATEGTVVHSQGDLQVTVSYVLGDGNDFGLVVESMDAEQPFGRKLLDGVEVGGSLSDTDISDDVYYELDPSPTSNPAKQIVDLILLSESPVTIPSSFSFRLEAAMSGGPEGDVIQSIELWNETDQQWEALDTRPATNTDSTVHVTPTGDLTRFIHPLTDEIIAKVKWVSPEFSGSPFNWSIDIDQLGWLID